MNFCANLKINPNLYEKIPPNAPAGYPDVHIEEIKKFLDIPAIQKMTEGDTIEIKRVRYGKGYGVEFGYTCGSDPTKSIEGGCYNSKNETSFTPGSFNMQTIQFLCHKFDVKLRFCDRPKDWVRRLAEKWKEMQGQ